LATILSHIENESIALVTRKKSANDRASDSTSDDQSEPRKSRSGARNLEVAHAGDGIWEFIHPRCATKRQDDIEEVEKMIAAGETEIALDELRWLLSECRDFLAAHKLLGDLALAAGDFRLARGHYGYAYQLGIAAIDRAGTIDALPSDLAANQVFFAAGQGLVDCLTKLGKRRLAQEVAARLLKLDQRDLLKIKQIVRSNQVVRKHRRKGKH
jgi:tetratricopeptide (TPR) repeat protein